MAVILKSDAFRAGFADWVDTNWHIWLRFCHEAGRVLDLGRRHYSARTIGEFIRHDTALSEQDGQFKCNDHAWPDCARLYVATNPQASGLFEFRGRGADDLKTAG